MERIMWTCPRVTIEGDPELVWAIDHELGLHITLPMMERFWDEAARREERI